MSGSHLHLTDMLGYWSVHSSNKTATRPHNSCSACKCQQTPMQQAPPFDLLAFEKGPKGQTMLLKHSVHTFHTLAACHLLQPHKATQGCSEDGPSCSSNVC